MIRTDQTDESEEPIKKNRSHSVRSSERESSARNGQTPVNDLNLMIVRTTEMKRRAQCVCVCVRERERVCVCVCVRESVYVCVCVSLLSLQKCEPKVTISFRNTGSDSWLSRDMSGDVR